MGTSHAPLPLSKDHALRLFPSRCPIYVAPQAATTGLVGVDGSNQPPMAAGAQHDDSRISIDSDKIDGWVGQTTQTAIVVADWIVAMTEKGHLIASMYVMPLFSCCCFF
jgi:hypothetical protein